MQALPPNKKWNLSASKLIASVVASVFFAPALLTAQLINVQAPLHNLRDNYYSNNGISFNGFFGGNSRIRGLNAAGQITPNIVFGQGSAAAAIPPFGGYDPNAGLYTGAIYNGGNFGFGLGVSMGKGNTRSIIANTPSVTMFNGQSASIFSGENRPFVTGITPVVGNMTGVGLLPVQLPRNLNIPYRTEHPVNNSPMSYDQSGSTAIRGVMSLAEISRMKSAEELQKKQAENREVESLVAEARSYADVRKYGVARMNYSRALRILAKNADSTELRETITAEYEAIKDKR